MYCDTYAIMSTGINLFDVEQVWHLLGSKPLPDACEQLNELIQQQLVAIYGNVIGQTDQHERDVMWRTLNKDQRNKKVECLASLQHLVENLLRQYQDTLLEINKCVDEFNDDTQEYSAQSNTADYDD